MPSHNQTVKHREAIHKLLNEYTSMSIQELSDELNVSPSTIRRNVSVMVLMYPNMHRTHGQVSIDAFVRDRNHRKDKISNCIVEKALSHVRTKDKVFLDSGNTAMSLAMELCHLDVHIVTLDIRIAFYLKDFTCCRATLIGGDLSSGCEFTTGEIAISQLKEHIFDVAFISTNCFDLVHGVTAPHELNAKIKAFAMGQAKETYLIASGHKFNKFSFHQVAKLQEYDSIITEDSIPRKTIDMLVCSGVVIE